MRVPDLADLHQGSNGGDVPYGSVRPVAAGELRCPAGGRRQQASNHWSRSLKAEDRCPGNVRPITSSQAELVAQGDEIARCAEQIGSLPISKIRVSSVTESFSPRSAGVCERHVGVLAESPDALAPIVIHTRSQWVIDGMHRLRAAERRGEHLIAARFFDGSEEEAFALAVHLNVVHGLPLPLGDRKDAAKRFLESGSNYSDAAIASTAGLSTKTVAKLRKKCSTQEDPDLNTRVGRDGKSRPVGSAAAANRRLKAQAEIEANPGASLRLIASAAGVSAATAGDVRRRIRQGLSALPDGLRASNCDLASYQKSDPAGRQSERPSKSPQRNTLVPKDRLELAQLNHLRKDPTLRFTDSGRKLLHLLSISVAILADCDRLLDDMPLHCAGVVAELATYYANAWNEIGRKVAARADSEVVAE